MSKFVARFRPEKDYSDEYDFKQNTYERKKRDKQRESKKQSKYFESYESEWYSEPKRQKR